MPTTHFGQSPISDEKQEKIRRLKEEGVSRNQISKRSGIAYGTAWNYAKTLASAA